MLRFDNEYVVFERLLKKVVTGKIRQVETIRTRRQGNEEVK